MAFLSNGLKYTIKEIADRFEMSERSVHRYIQTFREAGFIIPPPHNGRYFIDKTFHQFEEISELLHFSKEESVILQKLILRGYLSANSKQQKDRLVEPFDFKVIKVAALPEPGFTPTMHYTWVVSYKTENDKYPKYLSAEDGNFEILAVKPIVEKYNYTGNA